MKLLFMCTKHNTHLQPTDGQPQLVTEDNPYTGPIDYSNGWLIDLSNVDCPENKAYAAETQEEVDELDCRHFHRVILE